MGADVYLYNSKGTQIFYFRDSYNALCLLHKLKGSWWVLSEYETDKQKVEYLKLYIQTAEEQRVFEEMKELYKDKYYKFFMKQLKALKALIAYYEINEGSYIEWSV